MNKDQLIGHKIIGQWDQLIGEAKNWWGKLTDDQLTQAEGDREKLAGKIQETYGIGKEEAHKQI
ncbi:MAG: CsbD family protein [Alphaproteobacteria bacterium]|nr:CsbD family protein [Alphaproteobacteria bacterium]